MPVAHCFVAKKYFKREKFDTVAAEFAADIGVSPADVTLNVISGHMQFGHRQDICINLYLPSIWEKPQVRKIQEALSAAILRQFKITARDIFIMTQIIESGYVFENGKVLTWKQRS